MESSKLAYIVALIIGVFPFKTAHGQSFSLAACDRLDPGLVEVAKRCEGGEIEVQVSTCQVLRVLEHLSRGETEQAEQILTQDLALPQTSKERMMPWLKFYGGTAIDLDDSPIECSQAQGQQMLELVGAGLYEGLKEIEPLLLLGRVMGWSDMVMTNLEKRLAPEAIDPVRTVAFAVGELLQQAQAGPLLVESLRSNPLVSMIAGQAPQPTESRGDGDEALQQVDVALDLVRKKQLDGAREKISEALELSRDAVHQSKLLMRAGVGFLAAGFLEDGLDYLRRADEVLDEAVDPTAKTVHAMARWFHALAYDELGLQDHEGRVAATAEQMVEGEVGEILDVLGRSFLSQDRAASAAAIQLVSEKIFSGRVELDEIEPVINLFKEVVPGLDVPAWDGTVAPSTEPSFVDHTMRISELMIQERFDEAGVVAEELIDHFPRYNNVYLLSLIAIKQWQTGDHEGALVNCRKAIEALETKVESFRIDELQSAFVDDKISLAFRLAIEMAGQAGEVEQGFEYAERLRAWTLRRLLGGVRAPSGLASDVGTEELELLNRLHELEREPESVLPGEDPEQQLDDLRSEFAVRRLERKLSVARDHELARKGAISLEYLQSEVLAEDTTLLAYAAGLDDLWVWVVDRDSIKMVFLPFSEQEQQKITCLSSALRSPSASSRGTDLLAGCTTEADDPTVELYSELIGPIAEHLRSQNLIIVPHGLLHHVPFAALRHPETGLFLVEDFVLSLAPSASALELIMQPDKGEGDEVLVLGDPATTLDKLDAAKREAVRVAEFLGTEAYLADEARESLIHGRSGRLGLLHLAAHGQYVPSNPIFSRVVLSEGDGHDGALEVHEVWDRLDLTETRLVTLSGCQTALGDLTRGDEVVGLTQAFLIAGSRAVLSTLWSVDDEASEELMSAFYRRLIRGTSAAKALREAQIEMSSSLRFSAPYFWAGYTLTGDPETLWHKRRPWFRSWKLVVVLALTGGLAYGVISPSRFASRAGVMLSSEEDMTDGQFHQFTRQRGSRAGLFRDARVYIGSDFRMTDKPRAALARLRADGHQVRLQPLRGARLQRRNFDGDWEPVATKETLMRFNTVFRDEMGTLFFELRRRG